MMIHSTKLTGAKAALLNEYKKAIIELIEVIKFLNNEELLVEIKPISNNPDCLTIQTILRHVVASIFSYTIYIENSIGLVSERPERYTFDNVQDYIEKLLSGFRHCESAFINNPHIVMEELNHSKKINARWGQQYDIEQMLEHAIVHILRHRRQIENELAARNDL